MKCFRVFRSGKLLLPALLIMLIQTARAQQKQVLLALSKADRQLVLVDPGSLKLLGRVPVGTDPHEVIASADGRYAYVTIYGGGSLHELDVIDLVAKKPFQKVDTRPLYGPHGVTYANGKCWFTAEGSKAVGRYDQATGKVDWSMGTGQNRTHMLFVADDAKKIYTTNVSSGTVSLLEDTLIAPGRPGPPPGAGAPGDSLQPPRPQGPPPNRGPHTDWVETVVPTETGSEGFDVSPDGKELWTASSEKGTISVIDLKGKKLAVQFDGKISGANRVKFTPDGKQVFVTSLQSGDLAIYDAATHAEIKRIKTGHGAAGILMDEKGSRAFVACSSDDYIAIIDLKTLTVTGRLEIGGVPDGMAWAMIP